jgi:hypothetical protein
MTTRPDLDTALTNLAKTFASRAQTYRQKATEATEGKRDSEAADYVEARRQEAARANASAQLWEARAATARTGYLLASKAEYSDPEFMSQFSDVLQQCQDASRVVFKASVEDQAMRQASAGAPVV